MFILVACGESEKQKEEKHRLAQLELNKAKFYYPEAYDDYWRMYKPNLIGAQGWISDDCNNGKYPTYKVIVARKDLTHKSWGRYKGTLLVGNLAENKSFEIDYNCFKPDFENGDWLNKSD